MTTLVTDPSSLIVPFGKYQGLTVAELLIKDPSYAEWISGLDWFVQKHAAVHAALVSKGAVNDDSPEHNSMQVRFLDEDFQHAFVNLFNGRAKRSSVTEKAVAYVQEQTSAVQRDLESMKAGIANGLHGRSTDGRYYDADTVSDYERQLSRCEANLGHLDPKEAEAVFLKFEEKGIDVMLQWVFGYYDIKSRYGDQKVFDSRYLFKIELKPCLGEDYPAVLRQMGRLGANVLVIRDYAGISTPLDSVRKMFKASGYSLVLEEEIEAQLASAELPTLKIAA